MDDRLCQQQPGGDLELYIRDEVSAVDGVLTGNLTLVPGSNTVTVLSGGSTATRNANYDGLGNDATSDLLAPGAFLPIGGRIQVKIRTTINLTGPGGQPHPDGQTLYNQTIASGSQLVSTVKSDSIDATKHEHLRRRSASGGKPAAVPECGYARPDHRTIKDRRLPTYREGQVR